MATPNCLRLLLHDIRLADSRADCTAGRRSATSTPIMAITTSSSTSVKPRRKEDWRIGYLRGMMAGADGSRKELTV
jgi:hypothetical protein